MKVLKGNKSYKSMFPFIQKYFLRLKKVRKKHFYKMDLKKINLKFRLIFFIQNLKNFFSIMLCFFFNNKIVKYNFSKFLLGLNQLFFSSKIFNFEEKNNYFIFNFFKFFNVDSFFYFSKIFFFKSQFFVLFF